MSLRRILFVCIGNAYRSQMAEGFLRQYGGHEWDVHSAGLSPVSYLPRETVLVMAEKGIDVSRQHPKSLNSLHGVSFDVVVNMSGTPLPPVAGLVEWAVPDPVGEDVETLRRVRDEIEQRVQRLLIEQRTVRTIESQQAAGRPLIRKRPERKWDPEGWKRGR